MAKTSQRQKQTKAKTAAAMTKAQQIVGLLRRPSGASIPELTKATDWQAHSIRGFLSGTIRKKMGLEIASSITEGKDRRYRIAEAQ